MSGFKAPALFALYLKALLRNPWAWAAAPALAGFAAVFAARGAEVGLVSTFALALLALPPLWLALAVPLLAEREEWAFWAAFPGKAARLYRAGAFGVAGAFLPPLLLGAGLAGGVLGLGAGPTLLLFGLLALVALYWAGVAALVAALSPEAPRALGLGLAFWAVLVLLYEPVVVGVAVALADWPLEVPLLAAVLSNPMELARIGLLKTLEVPVLVGPVGYLLDRFLGAWGPALMLLNFGFWIALFFALAGWIFARRDR